MPREFPLLFKVLRQFSVAQQLSGQLGLVLSRPSVVPISIVHPLKAKYQTAEVLKSIYFWYEEYYNEEVH